MAEEGHDLEFSRASIGEAGRSGLAQSVGRAMGETRCLALIVEPVPEGLGPYRGGRPNAS